MRNLLFAMAALFVGGCFNPKIGEGEFTCGPANLCPEGYQCGFGNKCFTPANLPVVDMMPPPAFYGSGKLGTKDITTAGNLLFDTEDGSVKLGDGTEIVPAGSDGFSVRAQPNGGPEVAIWEFDTLTVGAGVTALCTPRSSRAVALVGKTAINVLGSIDLRGFGGPAGAAGKDGSTRGATTDGGGGQGAPSAGVGGGGGGYGATGGDAPSGGGTGGAAFGNAQMDALHVGAGGGGGGGVKAGIGGNGGGGLALIARTITISGVIDVSGNTPSAPAGTDMVGGGGGGAGGSIMLSAEQLTLETGHKLRALGGMGGPGANSGTAGGVGAIGRIWTGARNTTAVGTRDIQPPPAESNSGPLLEFPRN